MRLRAHIRVMQPLVRAASSRGTLAHLAAPVPYGMGNRALCGVFVAMPVRDEAPLCPTCKRLNDAR